MANSLTYDCPLLLDEDFQRQHPAIEHVANFLRGTAITRYSTFGGYDPLEEVGVKSIHNYLDLIQQGNSKAIASYERCKKFLGF